MTPGAALLRVLFVDDDPRVLDGLRRSLRPLANECDMRFVVGGHKALEALAQQDADVVVSDMRMPGMSGAQLLSKVRELHPQTIRLALSGQAGEREILDSVGPVQQFLMKPCDASTLRAAMRRLLALRDALQNPTLQAIAGRIERLPSAPETHQDLIDALDDPQVGIDVVGSIVARDPAMTAKCLQLVNSAFFAVARPAHTATEAVARLGLANVRSLAVVARIFQSLGRATVPGLTPEAIWLRSSNTASRAWLSAQALGLSPLMQGTVYTAGMLAEIGRLAIVTDDPDRASRWVNEARRQNAPLSIIEREALGASQAQLGGYLLGIWGFADDCVSAVTHHEQPVPPTPPAADSVTALHIARAVAPIDPPTDRLWRIDLDHAYLVAVNAADAAARCLNLPGAAA